MRVLCCKVGGSLVTRYSGYFIFPSPKGIYKFQLESFLSGAPLSGVSTEAGNHRISPLTSQIVAAHFLICCESMPQDPRRERGLMAPETLQLNGLGQLNKSLIHECLKEI